MNHLSKFCIGAIFCLVLICSNAFAKNYIVNVQAKPAGPTITEKYYTDPNIHIKKGDIVTVTYISGKWTGNKTHWRGKRKSSEPIKYLYYDGKGNPHTNAPFNYFVPGRPEGSLVGVIHDGKNQPYYIGNRKTVTANNDATLLLTINEEHHQVKGLSFADNEGSIKVQVSVTTP